MIRALVLSVVLLASVLAADVPLEVQSWATVIASRLDTATNLALSPQTLQDSYLASPYTQETLDGGARVATLSSEVGQFLRAEQTLLADAASLFQAALQAAPKESLSKRAVCDLPTSNLAPSTDPSTLCLCRDPSPACDRYCRMSDASPGYSIVADYNSSGLLFPPGTDCESIASTLDPGVFAAVQALIATAQLVSARLVTPGSHTFQYFTDLSTGLTAYYPALPLWASSFDGRGQPWFSRSFTNIRRVMIVLDKDVEPSETQSRSEVLRILIDGVRTLLYSLAPQEEFMVIHKIFAVPEQASNLTRSQCFESGFGVWWPASRENMDFLLSQLETLANTSVAYSFKVEGRADELIGLALDVIAAVQQQVAEQSAGRPGDPNAPAQPPSCKDILYYFAGRQVLGAGAGSGLYRQWKSRVASLPQPDTVRFHTLSYGPKKQTQLRRLSCSSDGGFEDQIVAVNATANGDGWHERILRSAVLYRAPQAETTVSYSIGLGFNDRPGFGMVMSLSLPIYDTRDTGGNTVGAPVLGVLGTDVLLDSLFTVFDATFTGSFSYSFMIDERGHAVLHPKMRTSPGRWTGVKGVQSTPFTRPITVFEPESAFADLVRNPLVSNFFDASGTATLLALRSIPKGDVSHEGVTNVLVENTFFWQRVPNTPLAVIASIARDDLTFRVYQPPTIDIGYPDLNGYGSYDFIQSQDYLDPPYNWPLYYLPPVWSSVLVQFNFSGYRFAPASYDNPTAYIAGDLANNPSFLTQAFAYFNEFPGAKNPGLSLRAVADNYLTRPAGKVWLEAFDTNTTNGAALAQLFAMAFLYCGTPSGFYRGVPSIRFGAAYDTTARPWYQRAILNGIAIPNSLSSPYTDAGGLGLVITLSSPASVDGRIEAVTSLDFSYLDFHRAVQEPTRCGYGQAALFPNASLPRCYLIDNSGLVIMSPLFWDNGNDPSNSQDPENTFIGDLEPGLATELINAGFLVQVSSLSFTSGSPVEIFVFNADTSVLDNVTANGSLKGLSGSWSGRSDACIVSGDYSLVQLTNSNTFFVSIENYQYNADFGRCKTDLIDTVQAADSIVYQFDYKLVTDRTLPAEPFNGGLSSLCVSLAQTRNLTRPAVSACGGTVLTARQLEALRVDDCSSIPLSVNTIPYGSAVSIVAFIITTMCILVIAITSVVFLFYVRRRIVSSATYGFLVRVLLGLVVVMSSVYTLSGTPNSGNCSMFPILVALGFVMVVAPMTAKMTYWLVQSRSPAKLGLAVPEYYLLITEGCFVVMLIPLVVWMAYDHPNSHIFYSDTMDEFVRQCSSNSYWVFWGVIVGLMMTLLTITSVLAIVVTALRLSRKVMWRESTWIGYALIAVWLATLVGFGVGQAMYGTGILTAHFVIDTVCLLGGAMGVWFCLFAPKLWYMIAHRDLINATATTVPVAFETEMASDDLDAW